MIGHRPTTDSLPDTTEGDPGSVPLLEWKVIVSSRLGSSPLLSKSCEVTSYSRLHVHRTVPSLPHRTLVPHPPSTLNTSDVRSSLCSTVPTHPPPETTPAQRKLYDEPGSSPVQYVRDVPIHSSIPPTPDLCRPYIWTSDLSK